MIAKTLSDIKQLFNERKRAYTATFNIKDRADRLVLEDLAKFCRAHEPTFNKDPRLSDVLEGRREVWLRIENYLKLTSDELFELHHIRTRGE